MAELQALVSLSEKVTRCELAVENSNAEMQELMNSLVNEPALPVMNHGQLVIVGELVERGFDGRIFVLKMDIEAAQAYARENGGFDHLIVEEGDEDLGPVRKFLLRDEN